ncbi:MAG: CBS domain-containing protein, partial [Burkholderiales bacterium]|nr:CBS domain-containing protein [Burkholderiales bacterium]
MKVTDILRVKGNTLFTVSPDDRLADAVQTMSEYDIGSLVVMEHGDLVGMLTFREVINAVVAQGGNLGDRHVRSVMDDAPLTCT